ncbi:MAG: 4-diphosphocytidyl-2-C-methyl-D-erythritol kinase [Firmicutes bacterium]|nr:4-diphosphocytidyl-2-C-methyl-D-erythritol kinase [Bacillota bacterium]
MIIEANAKINLALDILHKRADGYHEVEMVMQTVALADEVGLYEEPEGIIVETNIPGLDSGPSNLAYRAASLVIKTYGVRRGVRIILNKRIPMAAGLAGGSSDAAAVLKGLNRLWSLGLSLGELEKLGATLGSDVPFCLNGGTMLATGRGEVLSPLTFLPHIWVVLAKPPVDVSTGWVYNNYSPASVSVRPDIQGMVECLATRDFIGIAGRMGNVLESVTIAAHPEIAELKKVMYENGAVASMMSGSGPTVFGLTTDREQACSVAEAIRRQSDAWVIVTETVDSGGGEIWNAGCRP